MKKSISVLLTFFAIFSYTFASAKEYYTISEVHEQASIGWHETYFAHGREIVVDVGAGVPAVKTVPILKCKYLNDLSYSDDGSGLKIEYFEDGDGFSISCPYIADGIPVQTVVQELGTPFSINTYYYPNIEIDNNYFSGYQLTLREICDGFRNILVRVGIDPKETVTDIPHMLTINEYYDASKREEVIPSYGWADFYPLMHGVPVLAGIGDAYDEYPRYGCTPTVSFILSHEAFFIACFMLSEVEQLEIDVPLCSYEKVIDTLEKEIMDGHIRKVYDLNFGYAMCSAVENGFPRHDIHPNNRFYAVPVWMVNCMYVPIAKKELRQYDESYGTDERNAIEYQKIMVNAQTGELIDPMNMDKDRGYYKGHLSWNDVGGKP